MRQPYYLLVLAVVLYKLPTDITGIYRTYWLHTDAVCGWLDCNGWRTGTAWLYFAEVKPVTDDSVLDVVILIAYTDSDCVQV